MNSTDKTNPVKDVALLVTVIILGIFGGVYLRFADFKYSSEIADVLFLIAAIVAIRIVLKMMK
jgi:hypothetical protein